MARVLCYGDSNTWGTVPGETRRYTERERWPALLNTLLPESVTVIEEGQQGRTLLHNPPFDGEKPGQRYLKHSLTQYRPNLLFLLLGTNDLKARFALNPDTIANAAGKLAARSIAHIRDTLDYPVQVLLIAPPPVLEVGSYARMFAGAANKSQQFSSCYAKSAAAASCNFFDAGTVITSCPQEGIHWPAQAHRDLAQALSPVVESMLLETSSASA